MCSPSQTSIIHIHPQYIYHFTVHLRHLSFFISIYNTSIILQSTLDLAFTSIYTMSIICLSISHIRHLPIHHSICQQYILHPPIHHAYASFAPTLPYLTGCVHPKQKQQKTLSLPSSDQWSYPPTKRTSTTFTTVCTGHRQYCVPWKYTLESFCLF